jgi:Arc/MetJ-type ribon-helix-helix transcriptional regulator
VATPSGPWYPGFQEEILMAYQFPPDVEKLVKDRMALGIYSSEDEILRDALGALEQVELDTIRRWEERRRLATDESNRGLSKPLDEAKVLARLRERLAKEGVLD